MVIACIQFEVTSKNKKLHRLLFTLHCNMNPNSTKLDVVELNWWKILLFSSPFGFRIIGGYFRSDWIHLYWIDTYNVSTTVLGLMWTIIIPVFFVYFLFFGFKTDQNDHHKSKATISHYRRRGTLIITTILTTLTWFTLLLNPNHSSFISSKLGVHLNPGLLAVYFGLIEYIHDILWRSWSITQNSIGVEITSIFPNDKYRIELFGYASVVTTIGTLIGSSVPGYLNKNISQYYVFMIAFSIPFCVFALISAVIIKEPRITDDDDENNENNYNNDKNQNGIITLRNDMSSMYMYNELDNENENVERSTRELHQAPVQSKYSLSLIPTMLHVLANKPFLLLYGIELCTGFTFFSDIMIYKYYCKTSNSNIATLTLINNIISIIANLFWTLFSRKSSMKKNSILIIGFILTLVSNALVPFLPYNLHNHNHDHSDDGDDKFLLNPVVYVYSILGTIGSASYAAISQSLLADVMDYDYFLWDYRREAIFQGLMKEGVSLKDLAGAIGLILLSTVKNNELLFILFNLFGIIPKLIGIYLLYKYPENKLNTNHKIMSKKRARIFDNQSINLNNNGNEFTLFDYETKNLLGHFSMKQLKLYLKRPVVALRRIQFEMLMTIVVFLIIFGCCFVCVKYLSQSIYLSILSSMSILVLLLVIFFLITIRRMILWKKLKCIEKENILYYTEITIGRMQGRWLNNDCDVTRKEALSRTVHTSN